MTDAERQHVLDNLPSEFEPSEAAPPEGDEHTEQVVGARTALRRFFGRMGRGIYIGTNLPVFRARPSAQGRRAQHEAVRRARHPRVFRVRQTSPAARRDSRSSTQQEARRADDAEARLQAALAELERLKRERR